MQDSHSNTTGPNHLSNQAILDDWDQTLSSYLHRAQLFHQDLDAPDYIFIPVDERTEVDALILNPYNGQLEAPGLGEQELSYFDQGQNPLYNPREYEFIGQSQPLDREPSIDDNNENQESTQNLQQNLDNNDDATTN